MDTIEKVDRREPVSAADLLAPLGLNIGDYCHAHRWSDQDPNDPFAVGFLKTVIITKSGPSFALEGDGVPERFFPHCEKITPEEGVCLLARNQQDSLSEEPHIGDRVRASMNSLDWYTGVYEEESEVFVQYGVRLDNSNQLRFFAVAHKI